MSFLEISMLFGLSLLAAPVLIHLFNRSKPKPMAWGAMRFLAAFLCTQRRRLLLEEMLLMSLRCLILAALVLAMARPFLPSSPTLPWPLLMALLVAAALCTAATATMWSSTKIRRRLILFSCAAILITVLGAMLEKWRQKNSWFTGNNNRDIVIVVDASDSMRVSVDGRSNFERAKEDAIKIVRACKPGDAVGLILAGQVPCPLVRAPLNTRNDIIAMIRHKDFQPIGSSFGTLEALNAAAAMLAEGQNPVKRIIVFSDQQGLGWDLQSEARWIFLSGNLKAIGGLQPKLIVKRYPLPPQTRNAAVSGVSFQKNSPLAGQAVGIEVKVLNGGEIPIEPASVTLSIDGKLVAQEPFLKELPPGGSEIIRFEHRFEKPGRAVVTASISCDDNLPNDNQQSRVIDILELMPVLLIDGAPATKRTEGDSEYIRLALSPGNQADKTSESARLKVDTSDPDDAERLDLDKYRVIVIANPSRLPKKLGEKIMSRVKAGGGLMIVPGDRSDSSLDESFRPNSGGPFLPAQLLERKLSEDSPVHLSLKTFTHPALRLTADAPRSDAALAIIRAYWNLQIDKNDSSVNVGGFLDSGAPFIAERRYGRGRVIMTAFSMGKDDSSFPRLRIFVPTMHELVYYLASGGGVDANIKAGSELLCELADGSTPAPISSTSASLAEVSGKPIEIKVQSPLNWPAKAEILSIDNRLLIRCTETRCPGLYTILMSSPEAAKAKDGKALADLQFTVLSDPAESKLARLPEDELKALNRYLDIFVPANEEEFSSATLGDTPGMEIWKPLMLSAALLMLMELGLTRWIAGRRRLHQAREVAFNNEDRNKTASSWKILTKG